MSPNKGFAPAAATPAGGILLSRPPAVPGRDFPPVTEYALDPGLAWLFRSDFGFGFQDFDVKDSVLYAVAVRPGDVAAAVLEPQTHALLLAGLGAVVVAVRRRRR